MKTTQIKELTDAQAHYVVSELLELAIDKLIRNAHKQGSKGRHARAELALEGALLDAAIQLGDNFEHEVNQRIPDVWNVSFGYTVIHHAPGIIMISLKGSSGGNGVEG